MLFSSLVFLLLFLPLVLIVYFIFPNRTYRNVILLIVSLVFYGWAEPRLILLMMSMLLINYAMALILDRFEGKKRSALFLVTLILDLGTLFYFKYFNFTLSNINRLFGTNFISNVVLPIGISFYLFQVLSYVIDVYWKKVKVQKSFLLLSTYIALFPQLVAGPIVKAKEFIYQLYEDRNITWENFKEGIQLFVFGLFKKIVIADNMSVCVDAVFSVPQRYHAISIVLAVISYSVQIYCDFSGYSDMAIGTAKALGYDLKRNFNMPYISKNISDFWKRWHMSLSTWLQEYLYIPLGGNRKGRARTYINLFLTMLIGGLWHGASWTFVVWGALHGVALCIHKIWMKLFRHNKTYKGTFVGNICSGVITYLFVAFCWIFFRAENFDIAQSVILGITRWQDGIIYVSSWSVLGIVCVVVSSLIACFKSYKEKTDIQGFYLIVNLESIFGLVILFLAFGICFALAYTGNNPFIYFQF
jgi:alginate O-acetyltransferase complex protein AlgI